LAEWGERFVEGKDSHFVIADLSEGIAKIAMQPSVIHVDRQCLFL